jgi:hypothetical protein
MPHTILHCSFPPTFLPELLPHIAPSTPPHLNPPTPMSASGLLVPTPPQMAFPFTGRFHLLIWQWPGGSGARPWPSGAGGEESGAGPGPWVPGSAPLSSSWPGAAAARPLPHR